MPSLQQFDLEIKLKRYQDEILQAIHMQSALVIFAALCFVAWILLILYLKNNFPANTVFDCILGVVTCLASFFGMVGAYLYQRLNSGLRSIKERERNAIENYWHSLGSGGIPVSQTAENEISRENLFLNSFVGYVMVLLFLTLQMMTFLLIFIGIENPLNSIVFFASIIPFGFDIISLLLYLRNRHEEHQPI